MTADKSSLQEESRVSMGGVELPLPHPPHYSANPLDAWEPTEDLWDEAQMRSYARQAVEAERERIIALLDGLRPSEGRSVNWTDEMLALDSALSDVLEAIRNE
jgi:hypothetical protein